MRLFWILAFLVLTVSTVFDLGYCKADTGKASRRRQYKVENAKSDLLNIVKTVQNAFDDDRSDKIAMACIAKPYLADTSFEELKRKRVGQ